MIHYIGRERSFNCWLFAIGLLLRGRVTKLTWRWQRWLEFPHALAVTRRGNVVHFRRKARCRTRFGFWFRGRIQVFPKYLLERS